MELRNVEDVIGDYSGLSRAVLDYAQLTKRLSDEAKQPDFAGWSPLAELVDTDSFVRVGNFKEVMNWTEYVGFLSNWAPASEWECSFKRITETDGIVFLELEERSRMGDFSNSVNSASIYEFNAAGKITRIDLYLQMELPDPAILGSFSGVEI